MALASDHPGGVALDAGRPAGRSLGGARTGGGALDVVEPIGGAAENLLLIGAMSAPRGSVEAGAGLREVLGQSSETRILRARRGIEGALVVEMQDTHEQRRGESNSGDRSASCHPGDRPWTLRQRDREADRNERKRREAPPTRGTDLEDRDARQVEAHGECGSRQAGGEDPMEPRPPDAGCGRGQSCVGGETPGDRRDAQERGEAAALDEVAPRADAARQRARLEPRDRGEIAGEAKPEKRGNQ